jgi:hypothetical protein
MPPTGLAREEVLRYAQDGTQSTIDMNGAIFLFLA